MIENTVVQLTANTSKNIESFHNQILTLSKQNPEVIVVDMKSVSLIDSYGLKAILNAVRRMRENGGELVLWRVQPAVMTILELTQLDKVVKISYAVKVKDREIYTIPVSR
jgi:anti-anti-sigma factor